MTKSVMQRLYDSEINLVQLGDEVNGFVAEARLPTWADVEEWLVGMARIHFPHSEFARE